MQSLCQRRAVSRHALLRDGDPVGEPRGPPSVRAHRDDGVVAQRRDCHVDDRRIPDGEHDLRGVDVSPAPLDVVAKYDELYTFQTVREVRD